MRQHVFVLDPKRRGRAYAWVAAFAVLLGTGIPSAPAAIHEVGPGAPLVLPIREVIGGTAPENNAKNNPGGGYFSVFDSVAQFPYPATHGNQLGATAMVNDHTYWDSSPGGLDHTHVPAPDPGGGSVLWWPVPGEWLGFEFTAAAASIYTVTYRFSSGWGPDRPVTMSVVIDGVSSGPFTMRPDDPRLWADTRFRAGGWWGHTMVSGTTPVGWKLGPGRHTIKATIDSFPADPMAHGNIWVRYLKIAAGPSPSGLVLQPMAATDKPKAGGRGVPAGRDRDGAKVTVVPESAAMDVHLTRLRTIITAALASGRQPAFVSTVTSTRMVVEACDETGRLMLASSDQVTLPMPIARMDIAELADLSAGLADATATNETHAVAAFFALVSGRRERANAHLRGAGDLADAVRKSCGLAPANAADALDAPESGPAAGPAP